MKKKTAFLLAASTLTLLAIVALYVVACTPVDPPATGTLKQKSITVARGAFKYREGGSATGTPVVMIHGWPENSYCWDAVASKMNSNLRIIAPDLRGLGDSERTLDQTKYAKVELAKDIVQIVDALGITNFYLVGHDWGGVVAQEVALAIPSRVKKLVILNIHIILNLENNMAARDILYAGGNVSAWYQQFQQRVAPNLAEEMIPGNEEPWISTFFKDRPVPQESIDEYIRAYSIANTPATGASYYRTMSTDGQRWYSLYTAGTKFTMPLLYIYGNLDTVIIPEYLIGIENFFPSVQKVEIAAAHFVQEEKPAEVAQAMNNFFTGN
jgi:pimeloyl-ACP methyl ester carboxylesterase